MPCPDVVRSCPHRADPQAPAAWALFQLCAESPFGPKLPRSNNEGSRRFRAGCTVSCPLAASTGNGKSMEALITTAVKLQVVRCILGVGARTNPIDARKAPGWLEALKDIALRSAEDQQDVHLMWF